MSEQVTINIKKRPWYEWLGWVVWLVFELFVVQNAIASGQELEPRAAMIFWVIFAVVLLAGAIVWYLRRDK